jgi:hypothetical protein
MKKLYYSLFSPWSDYLIEQIVPDNRKEVRIEQLKTLKLVIKK